MPCDFAVISVAHEILLRSVKTPMLGLNLRAIQCGREGRKKMLAEILLRSVKAPALFSSTPNFKKLLQYLSHRMFTACAWIIKCRRKEKLIAQFGGKLRDERFEPN